MSKAAHFFERTVRNDAHVQKRITELWSESRTLPLASWLRGALRWRIGDGIEGAAALLTESSYTSRPANGERREGC
jgi:hypothetical protein